MRRLFHSASWRWLLWGTALFLLPIAVGLSGVWGYRIYRTIAARRAITAILELRDDAPDNVRDRAVSRLTACGAGALPDIAWAALHAESPAKQKLFRNALCDIVEREAGVSEELRRAGKEIDESITRRILGVLEGQPVGVLRVYARGAGRSDSRAYTLRLARDPRGNGVRELTVWLKEPDPELRWYTLSDLCVLGDLAAVPEIIDCLDDDTDVYLGSGSPFETYVISEHALEVLRDLTGRTDLGSDSRLWREWWAERSQQGERAAGSPSVHGE